MNDSAVLKQKFLFIKTTKPPQTMVSGRNHNFSIHFRVRFMKHPATSGIKGDRFPPSPLRFPKCLHNASSAGLPTGSCVEQGQDRETTQPQGRQLPSVVPTKQHYRKHRTIGKGRFPCAGMAELLQHRCVKSRDMDQLQQPNISSLRVERRNSSIPPFPSFFQVKHSIPTPQGGPAASLHGYKPTRSLRTWC